MTGALLVVGAVFIGIAGLGILRMPDLFARMQAASKASTLGAALLVSGAAVSLGTPGHAVLIIAFLLVTAPVAAQLIARAGYRSGARMRDPGATDDLDTAAGRDGRA